MHCICEKYQEFNYYSLQCLDNSGYKIFVLSVEAKSWLYYALYLSIFNSAIILNNYEFKLIIGHVIKFRLQLCV